MSERERERERGREREQEHNTHAFPHIISGYFSYTPCVFVSGSSLTIRAFGLDPNAWNYGKTRGIPVLKACWPNTHLRG